MLEVQEGYVVSFRAQVSDDDNPFEELEIAWFVDDDKCAWQFASSSGESSCDIVFNPDDTSVVAKFETHKALEGEAK